MKPSIKAILILIGIVLFTIYGIWIIEKVKDIENKRYEIEENEKKINELQEKVGLYYNLDNPNKTYIRDGEGFKEVDLK